MSQKEGPKLRNEFSKRKEQFLATNRTGMVRSVLACVTLLLLGAQTPSQSTSSDTNHLIGRYEYSFMFGGASITLKADGSFENDSGSCTITTRKTGTYSISGETIRFKILKQLAKPNGDENWVDVSDAKSRREFFHYSDDEPDDLPASELVLRIVKWGERTYLISEDGLASFVHSINLGLEPRNGDPRFVYDGSFFLREGDEEKSATGKPLLPAKYLDLLLNEPITATIVSIEAKENEKIATIDKGRLAGVKVGMDFIPGDQDPDFCCKYGTVISVEDTSARIDAYDGLVGEVLTTKLRRKSRF